MVPLVLKKSAKCPLLKIMKIPTIIFIQSIPWKKSSIDYVKHIKLFSQHDDTGMVKPCHAAFNPLGANPTKWSNTLKQFVGNLPTNCLSVFDHFVILALKWLIHKESADKLDLIDIANMFCGKKSRKKTRFWYFL